MKLVTYSWKKNPDRDCLGIVPDAEGGILPLSEAGLSFRDMAIITGDVEGFREEIETAFGRADVPYFIDASRGLSGHPLILLVTEALRTVEEDFSCDSFFACAKKPLR